MARIRARRPGRWARPVALLSSLVAGAAGAHGDGDHAGTIEPVLGDIPPALSGVEIELHRTLAPQLVLRNPTDRALAVLDENERAFLRIGPDGVSADLGAAYFHRSNTLMAPATIPSDADETPRWREIAAEPAWGWFDLRLRTRELERPHDTSEAAQRKRLGSWAIPVTYGGRDLEIEGSFVYRPRPAGVYEAKIVNTNLPAGVVVRSLPGPRPGIFVRNESGAAFTVLGLRSEPFLRFASDGVWVNRRSPTWGRVAQAGQPRPIVGPGSAEPKWARVSAGNGYGWIEPRAGHHGRPPESDTRAIAHRWRIPVEFQREKGGIEGATEWVPVAKASER